MPQTMVSQLVGPARELAGNLLADLQDRLLHTVGVARRAEELASAVALEDRDTLFAAAWLHDIGYSSVVVQSGFHPLDGARFLAEHGWPARVCGLVAHHSGAGYLITVPHLRHELARFANEESAVTDALAYADQTTSPVGRTVTLGERFAESLNRHGPASAQARSARLSILQDVEVRVLDRLRG